jgi:hypothetical protein
VTLYKVLLWQDIHQLNRKRKEMGEFLKNFFGWPKTKYSELSTYLTALACAVIFFTHPNFRQSIAQLIQGIPSQGGITDLIAFLILGFIVILGFVLSLYHVFTSREKSSFEKYLMGAFTIGANATAAITAGFEEINSGSYTLIFFPLWNILIGLALIIQIRLKKFEVSDENASLLEVAVNSIALLVVFFITNYAFRLSWAIEFSVILFFSSFLIFVITLISDTSKPQSLFRQKWYKPSRLSRYSRTFSSKTESSPETKLIKSFLLVTCPHCQVRVLPRKDGTCPSCQAKIPG